MLLEIVQAGVPVLRSAARPLTADEIRGQEIQQLIEHMRETMHAAPGVGLAAPQIGLPLQLAVIEDRIEPTAGQADDARERRPVPFHVIVNPVLTIEDATPAVFFEGCLSVHGHAALVPRAIAVRVDALDHRAEPVTIHARGWYARILQHEIDHLAGTLYLDRMYTRSFATAANLGAYWAERSVAEIMAALGIEAPARAPTS